MEEELRRKHILTFKTQIGTQAHPIDAASRIWDRPSDISALCQVLFHIGINERWKNILELGTGNSISTSVFANIVHVTDGRLLTVDRDKNIDHKINYSENVFFMRANLGEDDKLVVERLVNLKMNELDCLFIDADHRVESMERDFITYKNFVREEGFIIFHDVCLIDVECEGPMFWNYYDFSGFEKLTLAFSNGLGILRKISK